MVIRILSLFPHVLVCGGEWVGLPMFTGMSPFVLEVRVLRFPVDSHANVGLAGLMVLA